MTAFVPSKQNSSDYFRSNANFSRVYFILVASLINRLKCVYIMIYYDILRVICIKISSNNREMKERHMEMFAQRGSRPRKHPSKLTSFRILSLSYLFFFFSFSLFPLASISFRSSFVSFREKLMRFRGTKFREMNETGDLSRRDEINDLG